MKAWFYTARVSVALPAALGLWGCESGCNEEVVERAVRFLEGHQSCEVDGDCVIVSDFCGEIPSETALCGQLAMNRQGEQSAEWKELEEELRDCGPSECTQCAAAREPRCANGSCGGP